MNRNTILACVVGCLTGLSLTPGVLASEVALPEGSAALTAAELHYIYRDRTWQWADGAAFFDDEGRQFRAFSGSGADGSFAIGRWLLTDSGKLCMEGDWVFGGQATPDRTCFEHRTSAGTIYQRRLPDGGWYVFKHSVTEPEDEINRIVVGDQATDQVNQIRSLE
jgi:hypothetical protein